MKSRMIVRNCFLRWICSLGVLLIALVASPESHAKVSADYSQAGAIRVGTSTDPCGPTLKGAVRWNASALTIEMCDGATEWRKIVGNITEATTPPPDPNKGFFVLSNDLYVSNLGGIAGAHAKCLSDLTDNDWNGKDDAVSRGLLNSTKVRAWLCVTNSCQNLQPGVTYQFAVSGAPQKGGATLKVEADGLTHNNTQNWSGHNYWGAATYFTGRDNGTDTAFGGPTYMPCSNWTYVSGSNINGGQGISNSTTKSRWRSTIYGTCTSQLNLVCIVDP